MAAPYNDRKVRLNHSTVCHVGYIETVFKFCKHTAPYYTSGSHKFLGNILGAKSVTYNYCTLFLSQTIGGEKRYCVHPETRSLDSQVGEKLSQHVSLA